MDRFDLQDAKKTLLIQLSRIPDDEKTTSDIELEAALMNDWEISVERDPYAGLLEMLARAARFFSSGQKMVKNGVSCDATENSKEAVSSDDT